MGQSSHHRAATRPACGGAPTTATPYRRKDLRFFEYLATEERRCGPVVRPWVAGMVMIAMGLIGLALAWLQNRQ
jgi:hypothetical protein